MAEVRISNPKLTIGMAVYDDVLAWATIQAIRLYHAEAMNDCEILVIDNNPNCISGKGLKNLIDGWVAPMMRARYIPAPEVVGTSAPRDRVFREATGEAVLCIDCHIFLIPGAIRRLIEWYDNHPGNMDLLTGPLVYDNLATLSTHFIDQWRGEMWGIWGQAWETPDKHHFSVLKDETTGLTRYITLEMNHKTLDYSPYLPAVTYEGHEQQLIRAGCKPLGVDENDDFIIPGQGLGLFSCRKAAWLGFNPLFRGFGGEELYIHEKFRQAGRQCRCLGFMKWPHHFSEHDPNKLAESSVKYPLRRWDKVRNYVNGHLEIGRPLDGIRQHFVECTPMLMHPLQWDYLVANPTVEIPASTAVVTEQAPKPSLDTGTVEEIYESVRTIKRDLDQHMPKLSELAGMCPRVTEFTHRREGTIAFARSRPESVISYNMLAVELDNRELRRVAQLCPFLKLELRDSISLPTIEPCDLLFLDTVGTFTRLTEELNRYAPQVSRFIAMHDTLVFGERGEDGTTPGMVQALKNFLGANPQWFIYYHSTAQAGLTVLGVRPEDKPARKVWAWPPGYGPGTHCKALIKEISGVTPDPNCQCNATALTMDVMGVEGCREKRDELIQLIQKGYESWNWGVLAQGEHPPGEVEQPSWTQKAKIGYKMVRLGLNPLKPFESLVDRSIALAEADEKE